MKRAAGFWLAGALLAATDGRADVIAPYARGSFAQIKVAHAGRPLAVHFWSVTCIPCLTEMPRLAQTLRSRNDFDLVLVSTDTIGQSERIASRLQKFGLGDASNYAFADTFEARLRFEADRTWRGELPFTVLVRPDGGTTSITGELDTETLTAWLNGEAK